MLIMSRVCCVQCLSYLGSVMAPNFQIQQIWSKQTVPRPCTRLTCSGSDPGVQYRLLPVRTSVLLQTGVYQAVQNYLCILQETRSGNIHFICITKKSRQEQISGHQRAQIEPVNHIRRCLIIECNVLILWQTKTSPKVLQINRVRTGVQRFDF